MSSPPISISVEADIVSAAKLMTEKNVGCLFVLEGEEFSGVITRTDLVSRVLAKGLDPASTKVGDAFSKPIFTIDQMLLAEEAYEKIMMKKLKRLAVMSHGKVVGIISLKDLAKMEM